jgi:hypothetical protein
MVNVPNVEEFLITCSSQRQRLNYRLNYLMASSIELKDAFIWHSVGPHDGQKRVTVQNMSVIPLTIELTRDYCAVSVLVEGHIILTTTHTLVAGCVLLSWPVCSWC